MYLRIRNAVRCLIPWLADCIATVSTVGRTYFPRMWSRQWLIACGAGAGLLLTLAIFGGLAFARSGAKPNGSADAWQYLVVCNRCGQRERVANRLDERHPTPCSACGQGRLTSYRRGSQSLIPGGWATSQPTPAARDAKEAP